MYIQNRNRLPDIEDKTDCPREEGKREGQIRGLELTHTNYWVGQNVHMSFSISYGKI